LSFSIGHAVRGQFSDSEQIDNASNHKALSHEKGHSVRDELPVIRSELSCTHYRLLLKVGRPDVRKFYMEELAAEIIKERKTIEMEKRLTKGDPRP